MANNHNEIPDNNEARSGDSAMRQNSEAAAERLSAQVNESNESNVGQTAVSEVRDEARTNPQSFADRIASNQQLLDSFPKNKDGKIDVAQMNPEQLKQLDTLANQVNQDIQRTSQWVQHVARDLNTANTNWQYAESSPNR